MVFDSSQIVRVGEMGGHVSFDVHKPNAPDDPPHTLYLDPTTRTIGEEDMLGKITLTHAHAKTLATLLLQLPADIVGEKARALLKGVVDAKAPSPWYTLGGLLGGHASPKSKSQSKSKSRSPRRSPQRSPKSKSKSKRSPQRSPKSKPKPMRSS